MSHTRRLAAIVLFAIVTVEVGGWSLLGLITSESGLTSFEEQFFRAGHGHAGVLLILALVFILLAERTPYGTRTQVGLSLTFLAGTVLQSGGLFLHMLTGQEGSPSSGTWLTRSGAVLLAIALVALGIGLLRTPGSHVPTTIATG